jgi:dihydroorotate dehydrogenase (fumarate)/dihydroorotate dehydrogenase
MNLYTRWLRPLLFRFDPETVHGLACTALRRPWLGGLLGGEGLFVRDRRLHVRLGSLELENPVGLAPGFDKDCEMLDALGRLGFGYLVAGSVMCHLRAGNPRPRMVRLPERQAIVSCMGLPSRGIDHAARGLARRRDRRTPVVVNCNGYTLAEYLRLIDTLQPLAQGIEISLSCANEDEAGGDFLAPSCAEGLFAEMVRRKRGPLFIKVPSYASEPERQARFALIERAQHHGIDGLTVATSPRVDEPRLAVGCGGLSGRPLFPEMLRVVGDVYRATQGRLPIKARGGIFTPEDAFTAIAAGATTVEVYSGFIYEGWTIARTINRGLLGLLDRHGIADVGALRGTNAE